MAHKEVKERTPYTQPRESTEVQKSWTPKTSLGIKVKNQEITNIKEIFAQGFKIAEPEIIDTLIPNGKIELLFIGQAKGKFGGGQRRAFRQTQKKTPEGNKPSFGSIAVFGNENGYIGVGYGKSKDTVPSREKATRKAKLNVFSIKRGCGSWETETPTSNSIPFAVEGRCGSVRIKLMPAPPGKGLCVEKECAKILKLAGIKDVWSKTQGSTRTKINLILACMSALKKLSHVRVDSETAARVGLVEGAL